MSDFFSAFPFSSGTYIGLPLPKWTSLVEQKTLVIQNQLSIIIFPDATHTHTQSHRIHTHTFPEYENEKNATK